MNSKNKLNDEFCSGDHKWIYSINNCYLFDMKILQDEWLWCKIFQDNNSKSIRGWTHFKNFIN